MIHYQQGVDNVRLKSGALVRKLKTRCEIYPDPIIADSTKRSYCNVPSSEHLKPSS